MRASRFIFLLAVWGFTTCANAQTQLEINQAAGAAHAQADKQLNEVYQRILKEYAADPVFIANLREAQRAWVKFRDAEMKAKYPDREAGYYGSVHPTCWASYLAELTSQRTKDLRVWLTGIEEGDACIGSVKTKP